jgi:uncharacterized protein YaaR (DUF327 family)
MDTVAIIAVVGTLAGALISAVTTYMVQKGITERQRKWALEDEQRKQKRIIEDERRKKKQELLESRLKTVEEAMGLMMSRIDQEIFLEIDLPISVDKSVTEKKEQQVNDMISNAWTAINLIGSEKLKENWGILVNVYWEALEKRVDPFDGEKAQKAQLEMIKLIDKMRLEV